MRLSVILDHLLANLGNFSEVFFFGKWGLFLSICWEEGMEWLFLSILKDPPHEILKKKGGEHWGLLCLLDSWGAVCRFSCAYISKSQSPYYADSDTKASYISEHQHRHPLGFQVLVKQALLQSGFSVVWKSANYPTGNLFPNNVTVSEFLLDAK